MLACIRVTSIFLLFCIFQSGCLTTLSTHLSVEQEIGQLRDVASYEKKLDPRVKQQIWASLKEGLFYERFLKRIGAAPHLLPEQLSLAQKRSGRKFTFYLLIYLYRMICKAVEHDEPQEASESLDDPRVGIMELLFMKDIHPFEGSEAEAKALVLSFGRLWTAVQDHYITPFDRYVDGGDRETLEKSIRNGRVATYRALTDFCETTGQQ